MVQYPEVQKHKLKSTLSLAPKDSQILVIDPHSPTLKRFIVRRFGGILWHHWVSFVKIGILLFITNNLGIAHASSEADIYNGYFIPQGIAPVYTVAVLC